tara:strand:- start:57 stop:581 length:525 start_codon:yes stop_codon:yes gene_type:complete
MKVEDLENISESLGLTIKIQVREAFGLKFFRIVIAKIKNNSAKIWGEIKGWTFSLTDGLQLDTLRILKGAPKYVSELIWATTMAWALEQTDCKKARLLAIYDEEGYSKKLTRYFRFIGFNVVKEVGSSPIDLFLRLIWGGAGTLMNGDCISILNKIEKKFQRLGLITQRDNCFL